MITVLTVDDEMLIKRTLKKLIEYEGSPFQVVGEAEDGGEALDLIRESKPDLVITDIRMPVMDGLELVREVNAFSPDTRFVILSGHDDFAFAQQALRFGVSDYLLKPLKPDQLREVLGRVEEQMKAKRQAELQRLDHLWYCKNQAEPLAEAIWLLNMEEADSLLEETHRELAQSAYNPTVKLHYQSLLALLDGALAEKSAGSIRLDRSLLETLPDGPEAIKDAISREFLRVSEEIRQSRNWLIHQNMKKAAAYLQAHFAKESLSLQEVADLAGISPSYFSRMFKEEYGISFIHYVTKLRMERAKEMLADPACKTYEVAYAVGYQDYPHFTKVFKKMYSVSPSEYRKRIGTEQEKETDSDPQ